jgi:hypothetical protein
MSFIVAGCVLLVAISSASSSTLRSGSKKRRVCLILSHFDLNALRGSVQHLA